MSISSAIVSFSPEKYVFSWPDPEGVEMIIDQLRAGRSGIFCRLTVLSIGDGTRNLLHRGKFNPGASTTRARLAEKLKLQQPGPVWAELLELVCYRSEEQLERQLAEATADAKSEPPAPAEPDDWLFHLTQLGNARRTLAMFQGRIRWVPAMKHYLHWQAGATHWEIDDLAVERLVKEAHLSIYDEARETFDRATELAKAGSGASLFSETTDPAKLAKRRADLAYGWAKTSESATSIVASMRLMPSEPGVVVEAEELDVAPDLFNVLNGTLNLRSGELQPHRPEDLLTFVAPAVYVAGATHPLLDEFLTTTIPDTSSRYFIQKAMGAAMIGRQREDKVYALVGPTRTGKSTLIEAVKATLGPYAAAASMETLTNKRHDSSSANPELAALRGKRMVVVPEAGRGGGSPELLKALSGGDTISTRFLYGGKIEFAAQFTIFMRTNTRPRMPADDTGIRSRIVELPFRQQITSPRPEVRDMLCNDPAARSAMLAWLAEGAAAYLREGLGALPAQVQAATDEFWAEQDPLADFLSEMTEVNAAYLVAGSRLYQEYVAWFKRQEMDGTEPLAAKDFGAHASRRFGRKHTKAGNVYVGLGLRSARQEVLSPETLPSPVKGESNLVKGVKADSQSFQTSTSPVRELRETAFTCLHPSPGRRCAICNEPTEDEAADLCLACEAEAAERAAVAGSKGTHPERA